MATNSSRRSDPPAKQERSHPTVQPPKFFSFPDGKAVPVSKATLFKGKTFHIRCDFPDTYQAQLIKDIEALGGSLNAPNAWTADYVINNPPENDKQWQNELGRRLKAQTGQRPPIQRPYYWIYACHHAGEILPEDAILDRPVFTKWVHLNRRPVPLLVYLTVNLPRYAEEDGDAALRDVEATVESHGGFRSATRLDADVLVLNLGTKAGLRFKAEAKPDQVIWTREELEEHATRGLPLDLGRDIQPKEIVVARTNARSESAATTVRRTSRKEFTAEDDDLVLRYIAAYDPEKKRMTSKSFYTEMMNSSNKRVASWVHRHTAESWRERVKKRVAPFRLRVDAYLHDKVDKTLCTKEERERGSIPAGLRSGVIPGPSSTSRGSVSDGLEKAAPAVQAVPRKTGNGVATVHTTARQDDTRKRKRQDADTESERDASEVSNKKAKTTRKGTMPIDEKLRHSPTPEEQAGLSCFHGDSGTRRRLKPRPSAEGDVFDDPQPTGRKKSSPVKQTIQENRPAARATEMRPVLAPASSPPVEADMRSEGGMAKLKEIMDEVVDRDSVAEGEPDSDDAKLEQDLLEHIDRQERRGKSSRRGKSREAAGPSRPPIHGSEGQNGNMTSQVPDTQVFAKGESEDVSNPPPGKRPQSREKSQNSSSSATIRRPAPSVTDRAAPVPEVTSGVLSGGFVPVTESTVQATVIQIATVSETETLRLEPGVGKATTSESGPSAEEQARIRAQSDLEKREELKRIVVGLSQEYDLNFKAMHRLIEECRKRYQHVNQALLRGMIEQALAANAKG